MGPVVPFNHQRRQPFLRRAHVIGDDSDGVVEPHDLTHAFDGFGRRIVHVLDATAEDRRLRKGRDLHAWRPNIDAIDSRSVDLRWCVETLGRGADELEILWLLERHAFGDRHAGRVGGKFAIFETVFASAREALHRFARGRTPDRHSSALPLPIPAWFSRSRRLGAGAATPRVSRSSCLLPAPPSKGLA